MPTLAAYRTDRKTRDAIARQLSIVGEAVNHYRREPDIVPLTDMPNMVRFRNLLIHSYDNVNDGQVLRIIGHHLPVLRTEADTILRADEATQ